MIGDLNVSWIHGAPDCATTTDPPIQVHRFDDATFILRQSKCSEPGASFEAPFMYLLFGATRALLLDTGASRSAEVFPIGSVVQEIRDRVAASTGQPQVPLLVAHSHAHGDHAAGDGQLRALSDVTVVPAPLAKVKTFFDLPLWPEGQGSLDLGDRILDLIPTPGHESAHLAIYDRLTGILLTGDTLYPGLLVVNDWPAYVRSVARLRKFADTHPVSFLLGSHIEMTDRPGRWFGLGASFQPGEHALQLEPRHLVELDDALRAIGPIPRVDRRADFIIYPAGEPMPAP